MHDQGRRHTISGHEINDKSHQLNLRDNLLRSLAEKEAKSLHKIEEEKQELPIESYQRRQTRRRSTIVTEVLNAVKPPKETKRDPTERKPGLVSDVIKSIPKKDERRGSLVGSMVNLHKPPVPTEGRPRANSPSKRIPDERESRFKELAKLKYTSAARAAKMAFKEAHISMEANRRLSLQAPDHYLTIQTVARIQGGKDNIDTDSSTQTKFMNWRRKFQVGLEQVT